MQTLFHVSVALVLNAFHEIPRKCQKHCCSQACQEGGSFPLRVVETLARWAMHTICWFYRKLAVGLHVFFHALTDWKFLIESMPLKLCNYFVLSLTFPFCVAGKGGVQLRLPSPKRPHLWNS